MKRTNTSRRRYQLFALLIGGWIAATLPALATPAPLRGELTVAVASNFATPARALADRFEQQRSIRVRVVTGSTGALVAQAANGAPFDVLLAADLERPRLLVARGLTDGEYVVTYARGRLALWMPRNAAPATRESLATLQRVALANPRTAPYGAAALDALTKVNPAAVRIRAENVGQVYSMVASGNVDAGLVAISQVHHAPKDSVWLVPSALHRPIDQGAVVLARSRHVAGARAFLSFIASDNGQELIEGFGYERLVNPVVDSETDSRMPQPH